MDVITESREYSSNHPKVRFRWENIDLVWALQNLLYTVYLLILMHEKLETKIAVLLEASCLLYTNNQYSPVYKIWLDFLLNME